MSDLSNRLHSLTDFNVRRGHPYYTGADQIATVIRDGAARIDALEAALAGLVDAVDTLHAANERIMVDPHSLEAARALASDSETGEK